MGPPGQSDQMVSGDGMTHFPGFPLMPLMAEERGKVRHPVTRGSGSSPPGLSAATRRPEPAQTHKAPAVTHCWAIATRPESGLLPSSRP